MPAERRPDPEKLLLQVQAEEREAGYARLKIFLGYASGIGKTFRMFDEGRRRKQRGQDVVIASMQDRMPPEAESARSCLDAIPNRVVDGVCALDVNAILRRRPATVLIDGLAYDNPPGSAHAQRWQDVEELLANGISVITSINLQFIEEYREQVERLTGKRVTTTVPLSFIQRADEIEVVDAPPEFSLHKARELGDPGLQSKVDRQLSELREIALLLAADVVDRQLATVDRRGVAASWGTQERFLVCLTPRANAERMMASARRNADRFHGELYAVYVTQPEISPEDQTSLEHNLTLARSAGAQVHIVDSDEPVDAILEFARAHRITQIFVGHSRRQGWMAKFTGSPLDRLIEGAENMDIRVFPH